MTDSTFQWKEHKYEKGRYTPIVSVSRKGIMGLSSGLVSQFTNKDVKRVKLFYDKDHNALAFVTLTSDIEYAWPYKKLDRGGAQVIINRFIKQNEIALTRDVQRYEAKKTAIPGEGDGWFIVLSDPIK